MVSKNLRAASGIDVKWTMTLEVSSGRASTTLAKNSPGTTSPEGRRKYSLRLLKAATGWSTWPASWRAVSAVLFACAIVAAAIFLSAPPQQLTGAAETAGQVATVARVFWEVLARPVASYLFVLGISLALACALAWAALEAALGGASQR